MTVLFLKQQSCDDSVDHISCHTSWLRHPQKHFSARERLFYLWPRFYAGSWRLPCRSPLRRRREGWWSSTVSVVERSRGGRWKLGSLWKCPKEATGSDRQSGNKSRLEHQDTSFCIPENTLIVREWSEKLTGAPGFPGVDRGGMLGLLPGGGGAVAFGGSVLGGAGAGVVLGTGEVFKRLSASLFKTKQQQASVLWFLLAQRRTRLTGSLVSCQIRRN